MLNDWLSDPMTVAYLNRSWNAMPFHPLVHATGRWRHRCAVFDNHIRSVLIIQLLGLINRLRYAIMVNRLLTTLERRKRIDNKR